MKYLVNIYSVASVNTDKRLQYFTLSFLTITRIIKNVRHLVNSRGINRKCLGACVGVDMIYFIYDQVINSALNNKFFYKFIWSSLLFLDKSKQSGGGEVVFWLNSDCTHNKEFNTWFSSDNHYRELPEMPWNQTCQTGRSFLRILEFKNFLAHLPTVVPMELIRDSADGTECISRKHP